MISDHEQRKLRELERRLLDDDPEFPRSFDARARRLGRARLGPADKAVMATVLALGTILLVAGAPGAALALATVAVLLWLAWRTCRPSTRDNGSSDEHPSS